MIPTDLKNESEFFNISPNTVAKMMKEMNLKCKTTKKFVVATDSKHNEPIAPNLLDRQFSVETPDTAGVTDITYLKIGRSRYSLAIFIDLSSRFVIAWDLSDSLERHSAIKALNTAIMRCRPGKEVRIHSDQKLPFVTFEVAERILFKYIEVYYNQRRKYSTNGWKPPAHCEQAWHKVRKVA